MIKGRTWPKKMRPGRLSVPFGDDGKLRRRTVTARSRERGSHAGRPGVPGMPGGPAIAPSPGSASRSGGSRHRRRPERKSLLSRKQRMAAVLALVVAAFAVGLSTGFGSEESAEPTVQAFLLDWQQGKYAQAATLTNGNANRVTAELAAAYTDVDATNEFFAMKSVTQRGSTAVAEYQAT